MIHILNGDALAELMRTSGIEGNLIVCRECFIDGPASPAINDTFWKLRAKFISENYSESKADYNRLVIEELGLLKLTDPGAEINLWFENDLFCQANLWFIIKYLSVENLTSSLFRVFPDRKGSVSKWQTFGQATPDELLNALTRRVTFSSADVVLGIRLWDAYAAKDLEELTKLSKQESNALVFLREIIQANLDRYPTAEGPGRPQRTLAALRAAGFTSFTDIFQAFSEREEIYGYGDNQVINILKQMDT